MGEMPVRRDFFTKPTNLKSQETSYKTQIYGKFTGQFSSLNIKNAGPPFSGKAYLYVRSY